GVGARRPVQEAGPGVAEHLGEDGGYVGAVAGDPLDFGVALGAGAPSGEGFGQGSLRAEMESMCGMKACMMPPMPLKRLPKPTPRPSIARSEEHTSELQSREN